VPNAETQAAFAHLAATRTRLNDWTKQLNRIAAEMQAESQTSDLHELGRRYIEVQVRWDQAFRDFEAATEAFSAAVKKLHEDVEAHRSGGGQTKH